MDALSMDHHDRQHIRVRPRLPLGMGAIRVTNDSSPRRNRDRRHSQWLSSDSEPSPVTPSNGHQHATFANVQRQYAVQHRAAQEAIPNNNRLMRLSMEQFRPLYPARARYNVFVPKEQTLSLLGMILESFEDDRDLYYYLDISTALQMIDGEMKVFAVKPPGGGGIERVSFVHYDLHTIDRGSMTRKVLFAVIVPNDTAPKRKKKKKSDKWMWRIDAFLTADQIAVRYEVERNELPRSSRNSARFKQQLLCSKQPITLRVIEGTAWHSVPQIKSLKLGRRANAENISIRLTMRQWIEAVTRSLNDSLLPMAPVVVNQDEAHWIEWVKMIRLDAFGVFVGISCLDQGGGRWTVQSVDLDSGRIYKKFRLIGLIESKFDRRLKALYTHCNVTEIVFIPETSTQPIAHQLPPLSHYVHPMNRGLNGPTANGLVGRHNTNGLVSGPTIKVQERELEWIDRIVDYVLMSDQQAPNMMIGSCVRTNVNMYSDYI